MPLETTSEEAREFLLLLLPRLNEIEQNAAILSDSSRREQHEAAALNVLDALRLSAETALLFGRRIWGRDNTRPEVIYCEQSFLYNVGARLHQTLLDLGLEWPPPYSEPPPAVTRNLIELHESGSVWYGAEEFYMLRQWRTSFANLHFHALRLSKELRDRRSPQAVSVARSITQKSPTDKYASNQLGKILGGLTIAITLLQGPGAFHDFPSDAEHFSHDLHSLTTSVLHTVVGVALTIEDQVEHMWHPTTTKYLPTTVRTALSIAGIANFEYHGFSKRHHYAL
jgi:hypothetical protein